VSTVRTLISKPRGEAARSLVDSGFSGSPSFGGSDLAPHGKWQVVPVGRAVPSRSRKDESPCDARPRPFRAGRWPTPSASRSRCGTARPIIGGPLESILGDRLSTPTWWRRSRFSSWSAAREWKIEDRFVRSVVREMSISENYEGEIIPIRSNISRFSRGTVGCAWRGCLKASRIYPGCVRPCRLKLLVRTVLANRCALANSFHQIEAGLSVCLEE
jgi:hypothetical protein